MDEAGWAKDGDEAGMTKSIDKITASINSFVGYINQDLQISTPSKLFDTSPLQKAATVLSGMAFIGGPFAGVIANALDHEQLLIEIAAMTNTTPGVIASFYRVHPYSLEFIKEAVRAGAKLDEEDIKRVMEERVSYGSFGEGLAAGITRASDRRLLEEIIGKGNSTFAVTLPNGDRREVKAAYMEVDDATLYFEDNNRETILAYGPGHWVWAERVEQSQNST